MKNVAIPTAKAGELLAKPALVETKFLNASVRNVKDEEGKQVIVLAFEGLPSNILRNASQVKGDLSDYFTKEQLEMLATSPLACANAYIRSYKDKTVTFEGSYHEEGAVQTIDENSKLYINGITNPETNQPFAIGDTTPTTGSGIWVEGFITAVKSVEEADDFLKDFFKAEQEAKQAEDALAI